VSHLLILGVINFNKSDGHEPLREAAL